MFDTVLLAFTEIEKDGFSQLLTQKSQYQFIVFQFLDDKVLEPDYFDHVHPQIAIILQSSSDPGFGWGFASFLRRRVGTELYIIMLVSGRHQDYYCNDKIYKGKFDWIMHHRTVTIEQLLGELNRRESVVQHPSLLSQSRSVNTCSEFNDHKDLSRNNLVHAGYSGPLHKWENQAEFVPGWNGKRLHDMLRDGDYCVPSIARQPYTRMRNTSSWFYAIDTAGTIWVHRSYRHPDLVNGEPVYGAGEMFIDCATGEVVWINDTSGSYRPEGMLFYPYLNKRLQELGVYVSKTWKRAYGIT